MNKNIKRIIALALTVNAFCTVSAMTPGVSFDITTKAAYADSYSPSTGELKTLKVKSTNGDALDLRDDYNGDTVRLNDDKTYYAKLTDDSDGIKIDADVKGGDDYIVRIFTSDDKDATGLKPGDHITLGKGDSTIYVRTYESLSAFRKAKDQQNDVTICNTEYKINIRKTTASSFEDTSQDPIYLKSIELNQGDDISFVKQKTSYDVKLDDSISDVKITAKPEDSNARVRIDDDIVDSSNDYRKNISLDHGKNVVKIKVIDNKDNQRTYTLNIIRGVDDNQDNIYLDKLTVSEGTLDFSKTDSDYNIDLDQSVDALNIVAEPEEDDYLVTINGQEVKYDDDYKKKISLDKGKNTVKVVVNDEVNDKKRTYTLTINRGKDADQTKTPDNTNTANDKKPGWVQVGANWQYNDKNGNKMIGWVSDGNNWYYMDANGAMQSGWVTIGDNKFYLNAQANGTKGAMQTGWFNDNGTWYYLNEKSDGTKGTVKTGWENINDKWYYFNKDGSMQKGWIVDSNSKYYLDNNGAMVTGTQTIDGKEYKFNTNGRLNS